MYDNEYGIDDYSYLNKNKFDFSNLFKMNKKVLIVVITIILILIGLYIYNKTISYRGSYEYIEDKLEEEAMKYVAANNLNSNKEFYIASKKLNVNLGNNCYSVSGVFVNGNNYQGYLMCSDYETKIIDNSNDYIKLNGRDISFLNKGNIYVESSFEQLSNVTVNIDGSVGTEEGIYEINYIVLKNNSIVEKLTRKVVVVDNDEVDNFYPRVSLVGEKIEYLKVNNPYIDKGVVASDNTDGIIKDVKILGEVNTNIDGEYNLTYVVVNSKGYANATTRKVIVTQSDEEIAVGMIMTPLSITNSQVKIIASVFGSNYSYTLLPDGSKITDTNFEYEVLENGDYNFMLYDANGNYELKTITVSNIDKTLPTATCEAIVEAKSTIITVNANDNQGIAGYSYSVDGSTLDYIMSNTYTVPSRSKDVSVNVKDIASNVTNVKCNVTVAADDMSIVPIPSVAFKCNTDVSTYNAILASKVDDAGIRTREGVVAAANYLATELGYKIEYWWAGKHDKVGLNSTWGCQKAIWATDGSGKYAQGTVLPYGMDCTGFVKWAFVNGGFDASLIPRSDMQQNFGNAKPVKASFASNSSLINSLKKGDLLYSPGHIALIVGVDDTRIKLAQLTPAGLKVDLIDKFSGKALTKTADFTGYILLDEFYQMYGN